MEESDCCDTGYIHFCQYIFIHFVLFRFAKYSKPQKRAFIDQQNDHVTCHVIKIIRQGKMSSFIIREKSAG